MRLVCDCSEEVKEQCLLRCSQPVWQNMSQFNCLLYIVDMNPIEIGWNMDNQLVVQVKVSASEVTDTDLQQRAMPTVSKLLIKI